MAAVPCAECKWLVSPSAAQCGNCRAPIWVANPPLPEEPPPATSRTLVVAVLAVPIAAVALFCSGKSGMVTRTDLARSGASVVPDTHGLVGETIRMAACRHDWRACADNRDWARNSDWTGPQGACLALAEGASRRGYFAWDRSRSAPRFDSYVSGMSIRAGHIVLVDRGALSRDIAGDWVPTPLHCTFDLVARKVRSLAPP